MNFKEIENDLRQIKIPENTEPEIRVFYMTEEEDRCTLTQHGKEHDFVDVQLRVYDLDEDGEHDNYEIFRDYDNLSDTQSFQVIETIELVFPDINVDAD